MTGEDRIALTSERVEDLLVAKDKEIARLHRKIYGILRTLHHRNRHLYLAKTRYNACKRLLIRIHERLQTLKGRELK